MLSVPPSLLELFRTIRTRASVADSSPESAGSSTGGGHTLGAAGETSRNDGDKDGDSGDGTSSPLPLVEYVLLAEFDIDTGSTVRHQYPCPIPGLSDRVPFADYMLPEGAHNRSEDWTYMVLNRDGPQIDESFWTPSVSSTATSAGASGSRRNRPRARSGAGNSGSDSSHPEQSVGSGGVGGGDGALGITTSSSGSGNISGGNSGNTNSPDTATASAPLLYGVSTVRTKYDSRVRRGAVVKSIAVFSRYHFVSAFQAVLSEALEMYFQNPCIGVVQALFDALNNVSLHDMPLLYPFERQLVTSVCLMDRYDAIRFRHHCGMDSSIPSEKERIPLPSFDVLVNLCPPQKCDSDPIDSGKATDTEVKSIAVSIPLHTSPDEFYDYKIEFLLSLFGSSTARILNAILARQRVLFVGYNHAASTLAHIVLSAASLVSPPLPGLIRRIVPYATLSDLSFLDIPGYIAGVTNPMFQQHDAWFDLLCILDVPNGRGTVISAEEKRAEDAAARGGSSSSSSSSNIASAASTAGAAGGNTSGGAVGVAANSASKALASIAAPLMDGALSVEQMDSRCVDTMLSGLALGFGEDWIRVHCRDYVDTLVQQTLDITYGKGIVFYDNIISRKQKQMEALYPRVNRIMQSAEFRRLAPHPWFRIDGLAECRNEDAAVSGNSGAVSSSSQESRLHSSVAVLGFGATLATSCRGPKGDTDPSFNSAGSLVDGINDELLALLNNVVPLDGISVRCYLRVLQLETNIPAEYVHQIYHDINAMINTEKQLQALITLLPESPGGLAVIAVGLFHTHPDTRVIVANIIYKLEQCASTRHVVARLNGFYLRAYHRVLDSLRLSPPRPSSAPGSRAALRL